MRENNYFIYYSSNKEYEIGFSNRFFNFDEFFKNKEYVILKQIHSNIVLKVDKALRFQEADGIISTKKDLYLIIKTADCYPVIAYNKKGGFIAALHSGWRGVYKDIFKEFKKEALKISNKEILEEETCFIIGPGICEKCYKVGKEFYDKFADIKFDKNFFTFKEGSIYFNIRAAIKERIRQLNFNTDNIKDIKECTFENNSLFSYRRDKTKERLYNFIRLSN